MLTLLLCMILSMIPAPAAASPFRADTAYVAVMEQAFDAYASGDCETASRLCETILPDIRAARDEQNLGEVLSLLGASYHRLGFFDLAAQTIEECYRLDLQSGDTGRISSSLNNLAGTYLAMGDYDSALQMIQDAISLEEQREDSAALAVRYGMACDIYGKLGRYDDAIRYAQLALQLDSEAGRTEKAAIRQSQLGGAFMSAGRLAEAAASVEAAVPVFEQSGNLHSLSVCRQQQGLIAMRQGNQAAAVRYLHAALDLSRRTGNRMIERNVLKDLADLQEKTDPSAALADLRLYTSLNDSLSKDRTAQQLNEFRIKYDLASKEKELEAHKRELRTERRLVMLLSGLVAALLLLALVTWYLNRLRKQNEKVQRKSAELQDRLVELHDSGEEKTVQQRKEELAEIIKAMPETMPDLHLTPREIQVARLCAEGLLSKEIGERMGISQRTVETHKNNIFRKLGINTTVELVRILATRKDFFK